MEIRLKTPFRPVPTSSSERFPRYSRFKIPRFQPNFAHSIKLTQNDPFRGGTLVYSKFFSARPHPSPTVRMLPALPVSRMKFLNSTLRKYFLKLCPEHPPSHFLTLPTPHTPFPEHSIILHYFIPPSIPGQFPQLLIY